MTTIVDTLWYTLTGINSRGTIALLKERYMDYKLSTVEELADFIENSPCSRITQQLSHYRKSGNDVMVTKILEARKIVKRRKLTKQLQEL